ncbi:MAG: protein translocase subunit SecD [Candidatus Nomurabacteria bacterium]|nr:protein translocase subunit SecD [Candidatus Nomurabacteria bacterium]
MWKIRIIALAILVAGIGIGFFVFKNQSKPFHLGLDLSGGVQLTYQADLDGVSEDEAADRLDALRDVIERRVNSNEFSGVLGVLEPTIQTEKVRLGQDGIQHRVLVELPGVTDTESAKAFIGETPLLEFKLVDPNFEPPVQDLVVDENGDVVIPEINFAGAYIDTGLTGQYLTGASVQFSQGVQSGAGGLSGQPYIALQFDKDGGKLFADITGAHIGEALAIMLDGQVISAPTIQTTITGGEAIITGSFTIDEAKTLAGRLSQGALPVQIKLISESSVGPSLGAGAVDAGMYAGLIGILAVMIFMIAYYRASGFVSALALAMYGLVMLALFKLIPVTITAAGIAGFIISLGIAVDANILIFERMNEEIKKGRSLYDAISNGFDRAWLSIRDGNISSVIASIVILMVFKTSFIRGFAVTFTLGVIVSMATAVIATRYIMFAISRENPGKFGRFIMRAGFKK